MPEASAALPLLAATDTWREDGEVLALAEFDSLDSLKAWKEYSEHVVAQQRGREEFFTQGGADRLHTVR